MEAVRAEPGARDLDDAAVLTPGLDEITRLTGVPFHGVIPWLPERSWTNFAGGKGSIWVRIGQF